ncbi:hypothetical protein GCM10009718_33120 [Isoptericola halotolerans]|uniref:Uncharacterized protein n=1 Tax=Isoptericola halotolerans TaxID=300560 RepID=A0ABX2A5R6_9MICO|nr:hypothetical protein [Isoptericola halotolerans]NOV98200.1 hypothetical protein [Isoptericola halotolerans]
MSACISRHGEYSDHEPDETYACRLCGAIDTDALVAEVRRLTQWKAEALEVLSGWESVWESLGRPGQLGQPKSTGVLAEVRQLTEEQDRVVTLAAADRDYAYMLEGVVERVEALVFPLEDGGPTDDETLSVRDLRAALHPQEPHAPAQDAGSGSDGAEGAGGGNGAQIAGSDRKRYVVTVPSCNCDAESTFVELTEEEVALLERVDKALDPLAGIGVEPVEEAEEWHLDAAERHARWNAIETEEP